MLPENADNADLTRYLLGEFSEEEQMQIELRYFGDPQKFAELRAWRNDLIDAYVGGELSPSLRDRFEAAIDKSWAMNERIRFAETLQEALDARATGSAKPRRRGNRMIKSGRALLANYRRAFLFGAALLILLSGGWLFLRLRHQNVPESDFENSVASNKPAGSPQPSPAQTPSANAAKTNPVMTVPLTSDLSASANVVTADVLIPESTVLVKLVLIVEQPQEMDYEATVQTSQGADVFKTGRLRPHVEDVGSALEMFVPANRLPEGDYVISVNATANNQRLGAGKYYLRVRRP